MLRLSESQQRALRLVEMTAYLSPVPLPSGKGLGLRRVNWTNHLEVTRDFGQIGQGARLSSEVRRREDERLRREPSAQILQRMRLALLERLEVLQVARELALERRRDFRARDFGGSREFPASSDSPPPHRPAIPPRSSAAANSRACVIRAASAVVTINDDGLARAQQLAGLLRALGKTRIHSREAFDESLHIAEQVKSGQLCRMR